ncbi:S8 family serine peptidase [Iningainema tapete]|uniref:S8 family serine peptidase n=1 Tax=Iningainema tapete BLCC-T55 TaxID=2748662 RepID=A0A8J7C0W0_9CYAN|nr:S8 family serine peptidase [Iningainema tapete]MBD2778788.1 S8 family serine peptidase [Iningainema tapete BLCC-T55]
MNTGNNNNMSTGRTQPEMPSINMDTPPRTSEMPSSEMNSSGVGQMQNVLVEIRVPKTQGAMGASGVISEMNVTSFQLDTSYEPVPVSSASEQAPSLMGSNEETMIVRGVIEESQIPDLEAQSNVVKVYKDTPIAPFDSEVVDQDLVMPMDEAGNCPIGTCDCSPTTPKGAIADVAKYFGVDQIWAAGYKGQGIVVGVVDGGITAEGREVAVGETIRRIPNVIGGPAFDWGTKAKAWNEHGNMCATDVLGMAPEAKIYDCRISGGNSISNALKVFEWAINQHRTDGTPQILTNSWGIYQKSWDDYYATNPDHPFTRKVVEAINEGILVLFAAGNCGGACPSGRCGGDAGPGKSIWGANGHPLVITVGAVNKDEQFVGYSSQGPAALDPNKPDFCSITHFRGYFGSDNGTSAATPIAAGVAALFKQAKPTLTQEELKDVLKKTAKDIGPVGFDQHSGAGIIQPKAALDLIVPQLPVWHGWENLGGNSFSAPAAASWGKNRLDVFAIAADSAVYQKSWDGNVWSEWQSLGGFSLSAPAAFASTNRIDTFIIGQQRQVLRKSWDGKAWSDWENLGGLCKQGVAVSSWGALRLDVFTISADNAVWHKFWNGTVWSEWQSLGGFCLSAPAAVSWGENRIDLFVIGGDRSIYRKYWDGTSWSSNWENLGGLWFYSPAVTSWGANRLDVFAVGTDNALYRKYWDGTSWSTWENLGGTCVSAPGAVSWGLNRIDTFVIGGDNAVYRKWFG